MKDLAPRIVRECLLTEGFFTIKVNEKVIGNYFNEITKNLGLKTYGKPIIFSPEGLGKKENRGYDAFEPLIDPGISRYARSHARFLSCIIYSCKSFRKEKAIAFTRKFVKMDEVAACPF
ncbi:hypothetical protein KJ765_01330 [Candidatus Micrarchaeota archaeon]|nr:hypothetical protein [Candidatus Micrarchaeota archaeon]